LTPFHIRFSSASSFSIFNSQELVLLVLLVLSVAEGSEVEGPFAMCFRSPQSAIKSRGPSSTSDHLQ